MDRRLAHRTWCLFLLAMGLGLARLSGTEASVQEPVPAAPVHRLRVGVLPVLLTADDRDLTDAAKALIHDQLSDMLFRQGGYGIVTRTDPALLGQIMSELEFQNRGLVAPQETKALGRLAGIEVFVLADGELSVRMLGSTLTLRVRVIDVETSKLLGIFQVQCKGRARLDANRSMREAVTAAVDSLAQQMREFRPPSADSM
jgi:hypothetical protein